MDKKIILPMSLVLLIGLAVFVSATGIIISQPDKNGGFYDYQYELNLEKGWNLIAYGENFPYYMSKDYVKEDLPIYQKIVDYTNIPGIDRKKADAPLFVYFYNPQTKQYAEIFPENPLGIGVTYQNSAMWVYVRESTRVKYFAPNIPKLSDTKLVSGWNFVGMVPEMVEKSLDELKGSCTIEKAYGWDYNSQREGYWNDILDEKLPSEAVGMGFIIKVVNNCELGVSVGAMPNIPPIPNI